MAEEKELKTVENVPCTFSYDARFSSYAGRADWQGVDCDIHVETDADGGTEADRGFEVLRRLYADRAEWDRKAREYAAEKLTEDANDWLENTDDAENAEPITKERFAQRIVPELISVGSDGDVDIYFSDDDMFWGHTIVVSGNISGGFTEADIAG